MRRSHNNFTSMYRARNKFLTSQTQIANKKFGTLKAGPTNLKFGLSKSEDAWLDRLGVPVRSVPIYGLPLPGSNKRKIYIVDGFDPSTNTVYEFLGDRWHGYPLKYKLDMYDKQLKQTYRQLYAGTLQRFNILFQLGYKIIFVWESDWKKGASGRFYKGTSDNLL